MSRTQGLGLEMGGQGNVFEDLDELDTVELPDQVIPVGAAMPDEAKLKKKKGPNTNAMQELGGHSAYKPVVYGVLAAAALLVAFM